MASAAARGSARRASGSPLRRPVHVKMGKETEARGNMDIFIGRSHLLGLLLFSNGTWIMDGRVHGKRKLMREHTDAAELFKDMEVTTNFNKSIQV